MSPINLKHLWQKYIHWIERKIHPSHLVIDEPIDPHASDDDIIFQLQLEEDELISVPTDAQDPSPGQIYMRVFRLPNNSEYCWKYPPSNYHWIQSPQGNVYNLSNLLLVDREIDFVKDQLSILKMEQERGDGYILHEVIGKNIRGLKFQVQYLFPDTLKRHTPQYFRYRINCLSDELSLLETYKRKLLEEQITPVATTKNNLQILL